MKIVLDSVSHSLGANLRRSPLSVEASAEVLLLCAGAIVVISLVRAVASYLSAISFALVGTRVSSELRARTFRHLQSLSMRHHSTPPPATRSNGSSRTYPGCRTWQSQQGSPSSATSCR